MTFKIGIIGGSGLEDPQILEGAKNVEVNTPYGKPSDSFVEGVVLDEGVINICIRYNQWSASGIAGQTWQETRYYARQCQF